MLRNAIAIVSGGSSGLGAATVAAIIRHGGRVVVADLPSSQNNYLRLAAVVCSEAACWKSHQTERDHLIPLTLIDKQNADSAESQPTNSPIIAFSPVDVRFENDISKALDLAEELFGEPSKCVHRK